MMIQVFCGVPDRGADPTGVGYSRSKLRGTGMGFVPISVEISEAEERLVIRDAITMLIENPLNLLAFYLKDCNMASIV